jgi:hypothetical protein
LQDDETSAGSRITAELKQLAIDALVAIEQSRE